MFISLVCSLTLSGQHLPPSLSAPAPLVSSSFSHSLSLSSTHAIVCLSLSSLRLPSPLPTPPPPWLQAMFRRVLGQPLNRNSDGTSLHRWSAASADVAIHPLNYTVAIPPQPQPQHPSSAPLSFPGLVSYRLVTRRLNSPRLITPRYSSLRSSPLLCSSPFSVLSHI